MSLLVLLSVGLVLNAGASAFAIWRGSVDPGGAIVGAVLGTLIFAVGSPFFWLILMAFFLSSTALGRVRAAEKEYLKTIHQKGNRRDLFQVLANGGMGLLMALLFGFTHDPAWAVGFAVSFASSNADTWASELGVLSRREPVSLLHLRPVTRGISGGVSLAGCAASLAGAAFIALIFATENLALRVVPGSFIRIALFVTAGGFLGSLVDSLLGGTLQVQYVPADLDKAPHPGTPLLQTERAFTDAGAPNRLVRGLAFVNNDVVNFASCASVTLVAVLFYRLAL
jgi:uncharacterized protein (TIGR00297 family)